MVFEADEGLPDPVNELNVSIKLRDDENPEPTESFVITVEARDPCHRLFPRFSRQSALVHVFDDDSKSPALCFYLCTVKQIASNLPPQTVLIVTRT